ncbi:MAG: hypothetical protein J7619_00065 [Dyadobacter sp.]|uniref:hypothetical protein n=1 Tax=Dyadobacter sp. TaxID=1914288 RepID=UPI001B17010A|nr:hypothetical protein [Dyadobacter sp.]MBO9611051.1 hypothetical protein [Dyadobacter sp.]
MKTYKVVNRFHDAQNGYVLRKVDEQLILTVERGEELAAKGFVQAAEDDGDLGGSDSSTSANDEDSQKETVANPPSTELLDNLAESLKAAVEAKKATKGKGKPVVTKEEKNV